MENPSERVTDTGKVRIKIDRKMKESFFMDKSLTVQMKVFFHSIYYGSE